MRDLIVGFRPSTEEQKCQSLSFYSLLSRASSGIQVLLPDTVTLTRSTKPTWLVQEITDAFYINILTIFIKSQKFTFLEPGLNGQPFFSHFKQFKN